MKSFSIAAFCPVLSDSTGTEPRKYFIEVFRAIRVPSRGAADTFDGLVHCTEGGGSRCRRTLRKLPIAWVSRFSMQLHRGTAGETPPEQYITFQMAEYRGVVAWSPALRGSSAVVLLDVIALAVGGLLPLVPCCMAASIFPTIPFTSL